MTTNTEAAKAAEEHMKELLALNSEDAFSPSDEELLKDTFLAGWQAKEDSTGWIDVSTQKPEFGRILIYSFLRQVETLTYDDKELLKYFEFWQPLPEPPNIKP